jgi:hypothetical protein
MGSFPYYNFQAPWLSDTTNHPYPEDLLEASPSIRTFEPERECLASATPDKQHDVPSDTNGPVDTFDEHLSNISRKTAWPATATDLLFGYGRQKSAPQSRRRSKRTRPNKRVVRDLHVSRPRQWDQSLNEFAEHAEAHFERYAELLPDLSFDPSLLMACRSGGSNLLRDNLHRL